MADKEEEIDCYALLGVTAEASEAEIQTAYRKRSLKIHPDRNPDNPNAAHEFHQLRRALEILTDPAKREALAEAAKAKAARAARFASYDAKRRDLQTELEERERQFKRQRKEAAQDERDRKNEFERIKAETQRLMAEKEKALREREELARREGKAGRTASTEAKVDGPDGPLDTTVRLKWPRKSQPTWTESDALSAALSPFGETDSIFVSAKSASGKPPKNITAVVAFKTILGAFAAVEAAGRQGGVLEDVGVRWAGGDEPEAVKRLRAEGKLDTKGWTPSPAPATAAGGEGGNTKSFTFSSFPTSFSTAPSFSAPPAPKAPGVDYEAATLMRLRERERLAREIREQEEREEEGAAA